jgi:hypothetical protein
MAKGRPDETGRHPMSTVKATTETVNVGRLTVTTDRGRAADKAGIKGRDGMLCFARTR